MKKYIFPAVLLFVSITACASIGSAYSSKTTVVKIKKLGTNIRFQLIWEWPAVVAALKVRGY